MAEKDLAFVGDLTYHRYLESALDFDLKRKLKVFEHANTALEELTKKEYPLIIVRDELAIGDKSILPANLELGDFSGISCYVIKSLRKEGPNRNTPIFVPYVANDSLTPVSRYQKAGATTCINMLQNDPISSFIKEVRKQLRQL